MYENVIVPNEGSLAGRTVFAPAGDLAWRCGARTVQVSNTEVSDKSSKAAVKQQAISRSASDIEFWVDLTSTLATATLAAASYRADSIICVASPPPAPKIIGRRRNVVSPLTAELAEKAEIPVVVIGPVADTGRGLPMTEVIAVLDGTSAGDELLGSAAEWAKNFKLRLLLTAVATDGELRDPSEAQRYLDDRAASLTAPGGVGAEPVKGAGTVADLVALLDEHEDAVVMVATGSVGTALDRDVEELIRTSPRAVVLVRT